MVEARISNTTGGNDVLELLRDKAIDGLSVGFKVVSEGVTGAGWREIREASLLEISVVPTPAYDIGSRPFGARRRARHLRRGRARRDATPSAAGIVRRAPCRSISLDGSRS